MSLPVTAINFCFMWKIQVPPRSPTRSLRSNTCTNSFFCSLDCSCVWPRRAVSEQQACGGLVSDSVIWEGGRTLEEWLSVVCLPSLTGDGKQGQWRTLKDFSQSWRHTPEHTNTHCWVILIRPLDSPLSFRLYKWFVYVQTMPHQFNLLPFSAAG